MEVPDRLAWLNSGRFIRALAPIAGLALVAAVLYNATSVDRVAPSFQIKLSAAASNTGLAPTLTSIDVIFTEEVRHDTAERAFSITPRVTVTPHWQGQTLIFTPSAKLPLGTTFKVHIAAGVEDMAGNAQSKSQDLTFTTVGLPGVLSVEPGPKAESVPVDTKIQITFDRQMDTQPTLSGVTIEPDAPFTATWNGPTLTIVPNHPLAFSTTYTIKVGDPASDTDGTRLSPFESSFATVGMGLRVTSLIPAANVAGVSVRSPIAVLFDGPIDPATTDGAITLTPPVGGKTQVVTLPDDRHPSASPASSPTPTPTAATSSTQPGTAADATQNVLVFTPDGPLAAHTTYTVSMSSSVRRTDGSAAGAESWTFTTGEPPTTGQNQIVFLSDRSGVANVWLMNPDGSNQREITAELVPVSGFDVSGDGSTIAYGAGGIVKKMGIDGTNPQVLTATGSFDYAPEFTPDGTALVVGRRDPTGADLGYWRIPTLSGSDPKQVAADGAPGLGSVSLHGDELTGSPGASSWTARAAFSPDGKSMLLVRGIDNVIELIDMTGAAAPVVVALSGNSRPIWDTADTAFYVVGTPDKGATWSYYRVTIGAGVTRVGAADADLTIAEKSGSVAFVVRSADGTTHVSFAAAASAPTSSPLTTDPTWSEGSPSFSPDGSLIVFGRLGAKVHTASGGIWIIGPNGTGLKNLSTDGTSPRWLP